MKIRLYRASHHRRPDHYELFGATRQTRRHPHASLPHLRHLTEQRGALKVGRRWMRFAQRYQSAADIDCAGPIQLQTRCGGPACGRQRKNRQRVGAPCEMVAPVVLSWMVEWGAASCFRVNGKNVILFAVITVVAGVGEVVERVISLRGNRLNMIKSERIKGARCGSAAVFTSAFRPFYDLPSQAEGNFASWSHSGSGSGDRTNPKRIHQRPNRYAPAIGPDALNLPAVARPAIRGHRGAFAGAPVPFLGAFRRFAFAADDAEGAFQFPARQGGFSTANPLLSPSTRPTVQQAARHDAPPR